MAVKNIVVPNKEFILQHGKDGWRAISYNPHQIMTGWVNRKDLAIYQGELAVKNYYLGLMRKEASHE